MLAPGITIRPLEGSEEFHQAERIQKDAWNMDPVEIVPSHLLITAAKNGGLVLGAFEGEQMVGMLFGFLGRGWDGKDKHCSHMMGVLPSHRGKGIGTALKACQRDFVLAQGMDRITWTYDPLEHVNATLNIARLGATSRTYLRNVYGEMRDGLNQGIASDRLQVDWWIRSRRVIDALAGVPPQPALATIEADGALPVNRTRAVERGLLAPEGWEPVDAPRVLLEIPAGYQRIKGADLALAREWRHVTREVFEYYFSAGYMVTGFIGARENVERRCFYLLEKQEPEPE